MKAIIPRVPNTVTPSDLMAFSAGVLESKLHIPFTDRPEILSCDVLRIKEVHLGLTEHHGLISIRPDAAGQWFIQNVKNFRLHNKLILARKYHSRGNNRAVSSPNGDRRRKHLEIGKVEVKKIYARGLDQFSKTY
jgi:hypothetical protein